MSVIPKDFSTSMDFDEGYDGAFWINFYLPEKTRLYDNEGSSKFYDFARFKREDTYRDSKGCLHIDVGEFVEHRLGLIGDFYYDESIKEEIKYRALRNGKMKKETRIKERKKIIMPFFQYRCYFDEDWLDCKKQLEIDSYKFWNEIFVSMSKFGNIRVPMKMKKEIIERFNEFKTLCFQMANMIEYGEYLLDNIDEFIDYLRISYKYLNKGNKCDVEIDDLKIYMRIPKPQLQELLSKAQRGLLFNLNRTGREKYETYIVNKKICTHIELWDIN